jgi:hypothetical protein
MSETTRPARTREAPGPAEVEFCEADRESFRALAQSMSFVGVSVLLLSGMGGFVFALVAVYAGNAGWSGAVVAVAVMWILVAWWTMSAGRSFGALVRTHGRDVQRLMEAVKQLRLLFGFAQVVLVIYTFLAVLVAAGVFWCMWIGQAGGKCFGVFG